MTKPLHILLVEDSDDDAALVTRALQKHGLSFTAKRVETAPDFESALTEGGIDAILADFSLPRFSGIEALRIARVQDVDVPFILVSGTIGEHVAVEAMRAGAHDYVMKQNLARLGPALERELAEAEVRRARSRAEMEIRKREEWFRSLIEDASDLVAVMDESGVILYEAPSSESILGLKAEELEGTNAFDRIHPEDVQRVHAAFRDAVATGRPTLRIEYRYRHGDGTWLHLESVGRNLVNHPAVRGLVVNSRDVTERKLIESQLEQAQRLASLGHLAATIAHEFNNVLMGIQPFAEIVSRRAGNDSQLVKAASAISASVLRGSRITQDILRFTQPGNLAPVPLRLSRWFEEQRSELESLLGPSHRLVLEVAEESAVSADPGQLLQAIVNLTLNARDAMPEPGIVTIAARKTTPHDIPAHALLDGLEFVRISVADTGTGIDDTTMQHVFDPLFTTKRTGTGLGLAVTRQIIERHGGRILAESTPGEGTAFHIFLPSPKMEELPYETQPQRPSIEEHARILLIEDDPAVAAGLEALLEIEGFTVRVVSTGGESFDAITRFAPHALVLDVGLPDIDGIELYHQIAARWPELPVIFSTGHGDRGRLERQLQGSNVRLLLKPYDSSALIDLLEPMLRAGSDRS